MGEANFYYFTCLNSFIFMRGGTPAEEILNGSF